MNSTPEISRIDLFLTLPNKHTGAPRRMSPRTLDRAINWIAGHAEHNVQLFFRGGEEPLSELGLIERAVSQCGKWEACHPVQFTLSIVIPSRNLDEQLAAKLAAWHVAWTDRSLNSIRPRFSITPEGRVFASPPMTCLQEQDSLLLGDVFRGALVPRSSEV